MTKVSGHYGSYYGPGGVNGEQMRADPENCTSCRWVQVVTLGGEDRAGQPFVDNYGGPLPIYPFGIPENELNDTPRSNFPRSFSAVSILGYIDIGKKTFSPLGAMTWGYRMGRNGRVTLTKPRLSSLAEQSDSLNEMRLEYPTWNRERRLQEAIVVS
jgi:hypothetical protein